MRIKSQQDFCSGLMFTGVGVAFAWGATTFGTGTAAQMGPGYFPLMLGVLMTILGLVVTAKSIAVGAPDGGRIGAWAWRPLFFIIAANLVIGVMLGGLPSIGLPAMGLMLGIYALTFLASLAGDDFRIKEALVLATVLAVTCYFGFIALLNLQFQVWPSFMSG